MEEGKAVAVENGIPAEGRVSQFSLHDIILRCFKEAQQAEFITNVSEKDGLTTCTINIGAVAQHISKTAIGELTEFEIVRKLSPVIRTVRGIVEDCAFIDQEEERDAKLHATMRIKND
jgi:hypothetical protein